MRYEEARSRRDYAYLLENMGKPGLAGDQFNRAYRLFSRCGALLEARRMETKVDPAVHDERLKRTAATTAPPDTSGSNRSQIDLLRMDTLFDVSTSLSAIEDIDILLPQILQALIKATGAQNGYLFLEKLGPREGRHVLMDFEGQTVMPEVATYSRQIVENVKQTCKTMLVKDGSKDERLDPDKNKAVRSVLCVPLIRGDSYFGCVYLSNDRVSGLFSAGSEKAATILAGQAAVLLENAYLIDDYKRLNKQLAQKVREQTKDITDKNRELETSNLRLIESERMKDLLTGTLVHDIKNHVAGIDGNVRMLARRLTGDDSAARSVGMIGESCADIVSLASNLLDIGKMEEGKLALRKERIGESHIRSIFQKYGHNPMLAEKKVIVDFVACAGQPFVIEADRYLLERMIQNLVSNAAKYVPRKGKLILNLERVEADNVLVFYNSGPPIPDEYRETVFDKYSRIGAKPSQYSKGLGLFFCKTVVNAHEGRIWLETDQSGNYFKLAFKAAEPPPVAT
jgi:signal transduction histidine kinase